MNDLDPPSERVRPILLPKVIQHPARPSSLQQLLNLVILLPLPIATGPLPHSWFLHLERPQQPQHALQAPDVVPVPMAQYDILNAGA